MSHKAATIVPPGFSPMKPIAGASGSFEQINGPIWLADSNPPNETRFGFVAEPRHGNPYGAVHGGMLFTVADTMMGYQVTHAPKGGRCATITMNVEFIGAGRVGDWIEGRVRLLKLGRQVAFLTAQMTAGERLLLNASSSYALLRAGSADRVPATPD